MLNAAPRCASLTSISAGRRQSEQVGARLQIATDAVGRAEAHSADGYRLVDALICRPAPGYFEVAQLTHQIGHQRAERAALGDRVPSAALADAPPEAAPARGDLSWLAGSEPASAVDAPHGEARCAGRQAFNRLIKSTHGKACGYPARTLLCFRFKYSWAYHNSVSWEDPPTGLPGRCQRASSQVSNDHHRQQWTPANVDEQCVSALKRSARSSSIYRDRTRPTRSARAARSVAESCLLPGMRLQLNYTSNSRKRSLSFWRNHR